jgi:4-hydroxybenzoate polyprenyltransferase
MEFLNALLPYLYVIRAKNLLIVAANQAIVSFLIIRPVLSNPELSLKLTLLLILNTVIITAGGNLINDIFDQKTDNVNKPEKSYVGHLISVQNAWIYYTVMQVTGLGIAVYIAYSIGQLHLIIIYPAAVMLLFYYAYFLKRTVLAGNILISLFVSMVSGILLFAEKNALEVAGTDVNESIFSLVFAYMIFSFLINLIREIVKDMEDVSGDMQAGCKTLPIVYGIEKSSTIAQGIIVVSILLLGFWVLASEGTLNFRTQIFILLFCGSPLVVILRLLKSTSYKQNYGRISSILKWIMVAGLVSMIMIASI